MKNKNLLITGSGLCLLFTLFFGCGERSGEKEYNKAMASWQHGDLSRAQGQMQKAIRKLSNKEKRALANNQLGIILWTLDKKEESVQKFSESCRLSGELTGANMNRGMALYYTGQLDQARFEFTKIIGEQPRNALAHTFTGLIYIQQKEWKKATAEMAIGLKENPSDPAGHNALALAQLHLNTASDNAVARLKQIVATYPDYTPAIYNLAVIYDQWRHDGTSAIEWYQKYLKKAGAGAEQSSSANQALARLKRTSSENAGRPPRQANPEAAAQYIAAGSKLHTAKNYTQAIRQYEKALEADPAQATAHYYMGLSYYELKKFTEAIRAYTDALKMDPKDANARYMLVLTYGQQKRWNEAESEAKALKLVDRERGEAMLKYISNARKP